MLRNGSVIIAETYWPRAIELVDYMRGLPQVDAKGVELIYANQVDPSAMVEMPKRFNRMVRNALKYKEGAVVIMDHGAVTQARVLELLQAAERQYQREVQSFLIAQEDQLPLLENDMVNPDGKIKLIPYKVGETGYLEALKNAISERKRMVEEFGDQMG